MGIPDAPVAAPAAPPPPTGSPPAGVTVDTDRKGLPADAVPPGGLGAPLVTVGRTLLRVSGSGYWWPDDG